MAIQSKIISTFLGIRNKEPPRSIPDNALVDCSDCDLSDAGVLTQRAGFSLAKTLPISNSYSTLDRRAYLITGGILCEVLGNLSLLELAPCSATSFDDYKQFLFCNDGIQVNHTTVVNLKVPCPDFAPQLIASPGTLPPGTYRAVSTYKAASGLESGASPMAVIELTAPGNISIQTDVAPSGYTIINYLSEANGTVFYRPDGEQISPLQLNSQSMPEGELIAYHDSRLWLTVSLANGSTALYWSRKFSFHWWDLEEDYILVPGIIIAIKSAGDALVIVTNEAIFAYADSLQHLADYGCPQGRPIAKLADGSVLIHTYRGVCRFPEFQNLTIAKATFPPGSQCSTAIMDTGGISRFICLNDNQGQPWSART
jgi:hypothetical protein